MFLCESCRQFLHYFGVLVSSWLDDTQEKLRWNTESENAVHICPHDFKMEQCLEQFLEIEEANVHNLDIEVFQIDLQLALELLVLHVLNMIVFEQLTEEASFLHAFNVID